MDDARKFYEERHTKDNYSAGSYDVEALLAQACIRRWAETSSGSDLSILDVGCGKGLFLKQFIELLYRKWSVKFACVTGVDLLESPDNLFSEMNAEFRFIKQDIDGVALEIESESQDVVVCNHVLEHIFETEQLVAEFQRVLKPGGLCIVSMPNLAAWINRLLLLFAIQPLGTEVGLHSLSYGFRPRLAQNRLKTFMPSGHIRDFTPRALKDLVETHGLRVDGWWNQDRIPFFRLTNWSGRAMGVIAIKN